MRGYRLGPAQYDSYIDSLEYCMAKAETDPPEFEGLKIPLYPLQKDTSPPALRLPIQSNAFASHQRWQSSLPSMI